MSCSKNGKKSVENGRKSILMKILTPVCSKYVCRNELFCPIEELKKGKKGFKNGQKLGFTSLEQKLFYEA